MITDAIDFAVLTQVREPSVERPAMIMGDHHHTGSARVGTALGIALRMTIA